MDTVGEGLHSIWFNGNTNYLEDMIFLYPVTGEVEQACIPSEECWGKLKEQLQADIWWVQVKTKQGLKGWINEPDNFANKDSCA